MRDGTITFTGSKADALDMVQNIKFPYHASVLSASITERINAVNGPVHVELFVGTSEVTHLVLPVSEI
jgi:hypothetical protein